MKSGLTPFKYLAANVTVLAAIGRKKRLPIIILKEIWRQCALFLPLLALMASLLAFIAAVPPTRLLDICDLVAPGSLLLVAILAIRYLYLWTVARALAGSLKGKGTWQTSAALASLSGSSFFAANILLSPFLIYPLLFPGLHPLARGLLDKPLCFRACLVTGPRSSVGTTLRNAASCVARLERLAECHLLPQT